MKMLLNEKTKQEKIMNEVQKKSNLFGLGLTSLIAACGATDSATDDAVEVGIGTRPTTDLTAVPAGQLSAHTRIPTVATVENTTDAPRNTAAKNDLQINVAALTDVNAAFAATFKNGDHQTAGSAKLYTTLTTGSDLVVSSNQFGDDAGTVEGITGGIYIFWDIRAGGTIDNVDTTTTQHYLKVAGGVGDVISSDTPKFYQIGGAQTAADEPADQPDMVFRSTKGINILWDVTQHAEAIKKDLTLDSDDTSKGILQLQGGALTAPEFAKVNDNEGYDMVVKGSTSATTYILWDVAEYHDTAANTKVVVNLATPDADGAVATHGLLKITGTGTAAHEFIKVNNNEDYDMIVYGSDNAYILWDVANYHDAADAKAVNVNLAGTDENAAATHGLLTLTNLITTIETTAGVEKGFIDVDGGGINDLVFTQNYGHILFGEKLANRDGNGKAISHSINIDAVAAGKFYDKDGVEVTDTATGDTVISGFFHYDLDGTGEVQNVGYRFGREGVTIRNAKTEYEAVINPNADGGALSEEAYWDIA